MLWSDVVRTYRSGWPSIIVQLAVVTIVIVLFNAVVELLITTGSTLNALTAVGLDVLYAKQTALAATFAVEELHGDPGICHLDADRERSNPTLIPPS